MLGYFDFIWYFHSVVDAKENHTTRVSIQLLDYSNSYRVRVILYQFIVLRGIQFDHNFSKVIVQIVRILTQLNFIQRTQKLSAGRY